MRIFRYAAGLMSLSMLAVVAGLLAAATAIPLIMGWERVVVTSGSMEPGIMAGDIVFADPDVRHPVAPGTVLVFADPNREGGLLTHRVVEVLGDAGYRTAGDANQTPDSFTVTPDIVIGRGMALTPAIGTPTVWLQQGHPEWSIAALAGLAVLLWFCRYGVLARFDPWLEPSVPRRGRRRLVSRGRYRMRGALTMTASLVLLVVVTGAVAPRLSAAAFTATTKNTANFLRVPCQSQTLVASADTYVDQNSTTTSFGASTTLRVMSHAKDQRTLVRFPLSAVPSGCTLVSAKLRLYATSSVTGRTIEAVQATGTWSESTTWNTQPGITDPMASTVAALGWNEWDVTAQTLAMVSSGQVNLRLQDSVEESGTDRLQVYSSREGANAPQLVLTLN